MSDDRSNAIRVATVSLGDGFHVTTGIDSDGDAHYWIGPDGEPETATTIGGWPTHEMDGPLPVAMRAKIARAHCGRMTRSGKPCKNLATCRHHKKK